jgi:hypothetical protein
VITLPVTMDILSVRAVKTSCASLSRLYRPSVGAITHCLFRRLVHTANLLGGSVTHLRDLVRFVSSDPRTSASWRHEAIVYISRGVIAMLSGDGLSRLGLGALAASVPTSTAEPSTLSERDTPGPDSSAKILALASSNAARRRSCSISASRCWTELTSSTRPAPVPAASRQPSPAANCELSVFWYLLDRELQTALASNITEHEEARARVVGEPRIELVHVVHVAAHHRLDRGHEGEVRLSSRRADGLANELDGHFESLARVGRAVLPQQLHVLARLPVLLISSILSGELALQMQPALPLVSLVHANEKQHSFSDLVLPPPAGVPT